MILIITALNYELNFIKNQCEVKATIGEKPFIFYKCQYNKLKFLLGKSGLGKVRTASFLQYSIDNFKDISLIVNFGSSGAVAPNVKVGDFFLCEKAIEYDFETTRDFKPEFSINYEVSDKILEQFKIKKGILVSATQNVNSESKKEILYKKYKANIGDWEGSTVMQVSILNQKKCLVFKSVTDYGNENLIEDFKKYNKEILKNTSNTLLKLLDFLQA